MKIVAPAVTPEEVEALARAGANEFYCGFVPEDWSKHYHTVTSNRRPSGNFRSKEDMRRAIQIAHRHGCTVSMVLNAQTYLSSQTKSLHALVDIFHELEGDAVIVSELSLVQSLARSNPELKIHVSSVASCRNESAAILCQELGASRIILPRDVTTDEICKISTSVPNLEVEAFILNDACIFEEGACFTIHLPMDKGGPICLENFEVSYRFKNQKLASRLRTRLENNDKEYNRWLWHRFSNGFTTTKNGLPYGPCGLCAMPKLKRGNITAVKIAGREAPLARKLASVQMVKNTLVKMDSDSTDLEIMKFAQNIRPSTTQCQSGYMCYYPEILKEVDPDNYLDNTITAIHID
jgi:collagenase-like PrtC family protease